MGICELVIGVALLSFPHLATGMRGLVAAWPGLPFPGELLFVLLVCAATGFQSAKLKNRISTLLIIIGGILVLFEVWCLGQGFTSLNAIAIELVEEILHALATALWIAWIEIKGERETRQLSIPTCALAVLGSMLWYIGIQELRLDAGMDIPSIELITWGMTFVWSVAAVMFLCLAIQEGIQGLLAATVVFGGVLAGNRCWWLLRELGVRVPLSGLYVALFSVALMGASVFILCRHARRPRTTQTADEAEPGLVILPFSLAEEAALTSRERTVIEMALCGATIAQTSDSLGIARTTVSSYRSRALGKLGKPSVQELLASLRQQEGVVSPISISVGRADLSSVEWVIRFAIIALAFVVGSLAIRFAFSEAVANMVLAGLFACSNIVGLIEVCHIEQAFDLNEAVVVFCVGAGLALVVVGCVFGPRIYLVRRCIFAGIIVFVSMHAFHRMGDNPLALCEAQPWRKPLYSATLLCFGVVGLTLVPSGPHSLVVVSSAGWATGIAAFLALCGEFACEAARERRLSDLANASLAGDERVLAYLKGRGLGELEAQVAYLTALGFRRAYIARAISISPATVASYRSVAYALLGVDNRRALTDILAEEAGLRGGDA